MSKQSIKSIKASIINEVSKRYKNTFEDEIRILENQKFIIKRKYKFFAKDKFCSSRKNTFITKENRKTRKDIVNDSKRNH